MTHLSDLTKRWLNVRSLILDLPAHETIVLALSLHRERGFHCVQARRIRPFCLTTVGRFCKIPAMDLAGTLAE
jgi:hypothetical protein